MAEKIDLICPTVQAEQHATNWLDGQFTHDGDARIARRADRELMRANVPMSPPTWLLPLTTRIPDCV